MIFKAYIAQCQKQKFEDFGDKKAREFCAYDGAYTAARKPGTNTVYVHKRNKDHKYHSLTMNAETGVSSPTVIDPSDNSGPMLCLLCYGEYLISFEEKTGHLHISIYGRNCYTSDVLFKRKITKGQVCGHSFNSNRNVQLEGDMLYFIDTNSNIVIFDLKKLLDMPLEDRKSYQPSKGPSGKNEDFCVLNGNVSTLTIDGLVASGGHSIDLQAASLGTHFSTIETLAGYFVVASYDTVKKWKVFTVLDTALRRVADCAVKGTEMVQNMLLVVRRSTLHVLAAGNWQTVDHLLFNGDTLKVVEQYRVSDSYVFGINWLKGNEEVIVGGCKSLKALRL